MLSTPHLLVGAAITQAIPEPAIALPASFLSHFVLDATPHWDGSPHPPITKKVLGGVVLDYFFGMALIYLITINDPRQGVILFGAFLATAPDFIMGLTRHFSTPLVNFPFIKRLNAFHLNIQNNVRFAQGALTFSVVSLAAIVLLVR